MTEAESKKVREKILKQYKKDLDEMVATGEALSMKIGAMSTVIAALEKKIAETSEE